MFSLRALEYDKVLSIISSYANIDEAKKRITSLLPSNNIDDIFTSLKETENARRLFISIGEISLSNIHNCLHEINKAEKGGTLSTFECLAILNLIKGYYTVKNYFKDAKSNYLEYLYLEKYLNLHDLNYLGKRIESTIHIDGTVLDKASSELLNIRKAIKGENTRLKNKLQEILISKAKMLTEQLIVLRNNRQCVPVKVEFKNTFKGIIQDESSSGTTIYIEPYSTIEISNNINSLETKEKEIIEKILIALSAEIKENAEELKENLENYIKLDIISAKAKYAIKTNSFLPKINANGYTKLINARHPLLDEKTVVPLNIELGKSYQAIVITGPNTGGKTVALKTVGLLTLMNQTGILTPLDEASDLAIFDNVLVDIGDEQSIEQSLSTFSSHMKKIIEIINTLTTNSLVLLDELGSGTDPKEGSTLATAILNHLIENQARIIITTHYSELKTLAYRENNIINASVEFDLETYSPTYRMLLGIPGKSNALEIAKRLGLKSEIVEEAKKQNEIQQDDINIMISKLEKESSALENRIKEYDELIKKSNQTIKEYNEERTILKSNHDSLISQAKEKAQAIYQKAQEESLEIVKELERLKKSTSEHEIANVKNKIKKLKVEEEEIQHIEHEILIDDIVFVIPYGQEGIVTKINKNNYSVSIGNLNSTFKKEDLNYVRKNKKDKPKSVMTSTIRKDAKLELDLRGYRYEEALIELDKFIDRAILANIGMVYIIHGFGTGAVRNAVRNYLKENKAIKEFRYGGEGEGLNGVTVAYLK